MSRPPQDIFTRYANKKREYEALSERDRNTFEGKRLSRTIQKLKKRIDEMNRNIPSFTGNISENRLFQK